MRGSFLVNGFSRFIVPLRFIVPNFLYPEVFARFSRGFREVFARFSRGFRKVFARLSLQKYFRERFARAEKKINFCVPLGPPPHRGRRRTGAPAARKNWEEPSCPVRPPVRHFRNENFSLDGALNRMYKIIRQLNPQPYELLPHTFIPVIVMASPSSFLMQ